jgi:divalent metal cation (Fe/Co/Zn/Cd) transporter
VSIEAARDLIVSAEPDESLPGIILAAVSLVAMPLLAMAKHRTGHRLGSATLIADSQETLLCSYLSAVLLAGLALNAFLGWWWADPAAALGIAYLAVREGLEAWRGEHEEHEASSSH